MVLYIETYYCTYTDIWPHFNFLLLILLLLLYFLFHAYYAAAAVCVGAVYSFSMCVLFIINTHNIHMSIKYNVQFVHAAQHVCSTRERMVKKKIVYHWRINKYEEVVKIIVILNAIVDCASARAWVHKFICVYIIQIYTHILVYSVGMWRINMEVNIFMIWFYRG